MHEWFDIVEEAVTSAVPRQRHRGNRAMLWGRKQVRRSVPLSRVH